MKSEHRINSFTYLDVRCFDVQMYTQTFELFLCYKCFCCYKKKKINKQKNVPAITGPSSRASE